MGIDETVPGVVQYERRVVVFRGPGVPRKHPSALLRPGGGANRQC